MTQDKIKATIQASMDKIEELDQGFFGDSLGVGLALKELRKNLDEIDACLTSRDYSQASSIGYGDVATNFVYLQRALGGLQDRVHEKEAFISDIALKSGNCSGSQSKCGGIAIKTILGAQSLTLSIPLGSQSLPMGSDSLTL